MSNFWIITCFWCLSYIIYPVQVFLFLNQKTKLNIREATISRLQIKHFFQTITLTVKNFEVEVYIGITAQDRLEICSMSRRKIKENVCLYPAKTSVLVPNNYTMLQLSIQCSNYLYNAPSIYTMFQLSIQCSNYLYNTPTIYTMYQLSIQCSNYLYNVPTIYTMLQLYIQCSNYLYNAPTIYTMPQLSI